MPYKRECKCCSEIFQPYSKTNRICDSCDRKIKQRNIRRNLKKAKKTYKTRRLFLEKIRNGEVGILN